MQSLRSGRSQAPRKSTRQQTKLAKPGAGPTPRPRAADARKSRVDDKIKKRMSMRYADISSPTELNVPPMPTIGVGVGARKTTPRERDEELVKAYESIEDKDIKEKASSEDDKKILDKSDFDPDAYLKSKLANSTEAEIKSLQSSLRSAKDDTSAELQKNVFKNYAEFVNISKEISTLENEMLELKESISEYKAMPSLLHIPDPTSTTSSTLSTYRRSSVADLRIMYFNQMQQLHSQVEGSSKLAPTTPGRHVVSEADGVLALNAATYKVVGKVKFIILDDMVLVAKKRRRTGAAEGKLVADKGWPLQEMLVLDTKDSPNMTNVFKIRHGKLTHVYRTETPAEKKALLTQLRHVGEELSAKRRKEREGEHERRKTLWSGGDVRPRTLGHASAADWMADLAARAGEASPANDAKEKAERDARWTSEWADELNVAIALKEWESAVKLVEEGKAKLAVTPPLAAKLPLLTAQLTEALLETLSHPSNRKTIVVQLISLLLRLGAGAAARATFLNMRSQVMHNLVRKIKFEGHVGAYVADLAMVYFTGIKHTADWFLASFKENEVASVFIDWAKRQVEDYAEIFRNQVYTGDVETKVIEEAMRITYSLSKKLLEEYGLDFRFLLDEQLIEKPKEAPKPVTTSYTAAGHEMLQRYSLQKSTSHRKIPTSSSVSSFNTSSSSPTTDTSRTERVTATPTSSTLSIAISDRAPSPSRDTTPTGSSFSRPQLRPPNVAGPRSRTPSSATSPSYPPALSSPQPKRTRTPPPHSGSDSPQAETPVKEQPSRSLRGSPAPPPRSSNRPSSVRQLPVAIAQREGMI
ncbi:nuclear mrna splicing protein [Moniliophthora roreri MCA 2997]|uniref:Exocyst complex component EXO84 n=1 Tax=Moniliophthora roreri (strain MCA 2997) TaxID=1381753 RepID=V2XAG2_MONRO|nr:nuclear mrna splicing protein [Moniliophthora roreri MCA 2997]